MDFSRLSRSARSRLHLGSVPVALYVGLIVVILGAIGFAVSSVVSALGAQTFEIEAQESAAGDAGDAASEATEPATLFVHVAGAVCNPGLYELPVGSRVADAVGAAGGFTEAAATQSVNLARQLNDGEQILVGEAAAIPEPSEAAASASTTAATPTADGLVNINTASAEELQTLDGVGPATAEKIVKDRTANGPFQTVDDLTRVSGIGEKKLEAIRDSICV